MTEDLENGSYGEKITYVSISPDGSLIATFNPYKSCISIENVLENEKNDKAMDSRTVKTTIEVDNNQFFDKKPQNILGWSLAVSDIIDNDAGLVAISCITDDDMNQEETIEEGSFQKAYLRLSSINIREIHYSLLHIPIEIVSYCTNLFFIDPNPVSNPLPYVLFIGIPFLILALPEFFYVSKILRGDSKQYQLSRTYSKGMIRLFKFSLNKNCYDNGTSIFHLGGVVTFLKSFKKNSATLVCTNCVKIKKFKIKLRKNISVSKSNTYLLPENLFKKLENIKDAKINWKYILKSRYQEFLMIDTNDHQKIKNIEIYNINTLQLVNVFHRHREEDFLISNDNEPGIFSISTDSRLFAYSYGDNIITIYLMESGLEVVSKKFNDICEIIFLEFIDDDKKLFIIEQGKGGDVKFHIWLMSGCLNDYFPIPKDDITLSDNIFTLLKYDEHYYTIAKANGKVVFLNDKDNENQFKVIPEMFINMDTFDENNSIIDKHEHIYYSHDIEPWNDKAEYISGRFLNNDKKFLLIIGQNSIQLWKSKSQNFKDFEDFKSFENSDLVYIFISNIPFESRPKFQIKNDMTTIIIHACKSLAYLYNHRHIRRVDSKEKHQKFVSGIKNIIKDFIRKYPDNWKLMEVQYPLMAYLIYSRSFSLIKYILFGTNGQTSSQEKNTELLHRPQKNYVSYPYYHELRLYDDFKLEDEDLISTNDLEFALKYCKDRDAVILAYLLEYYSENSMTHIANYMDLLLYKPCFGEMKYNFPIKRFKELSVHQDAIKVYMPLTRLLSPKEIFGYKRMRNNILPDIYMVPLSNFTSYNPKAKEKTKKTLIGTSIASLRCLRSILIPPYYRDLNAKDFSPFLQIEKNENEFFNIPSMGATINSRWRQAMKFILLGHPSLLDVYPSTSTFTLDNGTENLTLTGPSQDNPFDTIWDSILSMYYMNTIDLNNYNYWQLKLFALVANIVVVLVLFNMIIALMKAELINDFERLDISYHSLTFYNSPYICFHQDPELMKKWMKKSQEFRETKLYSWFNESVDKEIITYDNEDIKSWYEALIMNNENQDSLSIISSSSSAPDLMILGS
ncbi:19696_t:CDS:2 [Rhizophagus irregularis]|nr:19696_t:CDS:2 [Rhizophagus irregularis]